MELGFSPHKVVDTQRSREVPQALVLTARVLIYSHLSIPRIVINSSRSSQRVLELEGSPVLWTGTASSSLSPGPGIK